MATAVVVADASRARVFTTDATFDTWSETTDLAHPASRLRNVDLVTDDAHGQGARNRNRKDAHAVEEDAFAAELNDWMTEQTGAFEAFVLVAPPHFLGRLRASRPKSLEPQVAVEIKRDFTREDGDEIRSRVHELLKQQPLIRA